MFNVIAFYKPEFLPFNSRKSSYLVKSKLSIFVLIIIERFSLKLYLLYAGCIFNLLISLPSTAQIIPDTTLPNNSIVPLDCSNCEITGGTIRGNNLFHSFEQFSIPTAGSAYFNNTANIENIISRVTGKSISNINGLIRANDTASLFLMNPNGIIFGSNAYLNIGGSFIATTANRLRFADGTEFIATSNQAIPLLTITAPVGLGFGTQPGTIVNQANALDIDQNPIGLQVLSGKTLALVGGEVLIEGGFLTTPGGRIELTSVSDNSLVSLTPIDKGWILGYENTQNFRDISLSQAAYIGSSDFKGADIQIQANRVTLTQGSQIRNVAGNDAQPGNLKVNALEQLELVATPEDLFLTGILNEVVGTATGEGFALTINTKKLIVQGGAQISTSSFGTGRGVNLIVRASESVELAGGSPTFNLPSGLFAQVDTTATGNGGTLVIETRLLNVFEGAQVATSTFGSGDAGDLRILASSVKVAGRRADNIIGSGLFAQVNEQATGDGGNLTIETQQLEISGGAQVSTAARSGGRGGTLNIKASDSILVTGTAPVQDEFAKSNILVSADPGATRDAGELNITTGQLVVEDSARISADNFGLGKGGSGTFNVGKLIIRNGGEVRAGSFADGNGGILTVNASESVDIVGAATIAGKTIPSTLFSQALAGGNAGNLIVNTPILNVRDGAEVTVSAKGTGAAGNLTVGANTIRLNRGRLTAETAAGNGANINLNELKLLGLENQSLISAQAFNQASGGNININAPNGFIVAFPNQNNDIVANAVAGQGGKISINARSLFNLGESKSIPENFTNDIDASSEFGLDGEVLINTPDVDPSRGLVELPSGLTDASQQIASSCNPGVRARGNSFSVTGRSGMAPSPTEPLQTEVQTGRWITFNAVTSKQTGYISSTTNNNIVEAQHWVKDKDGGVVLVARAPVQIGLLGSRNLCH